jgi:endonuclease/exonuclease/phosphatase family metal-dependent hydrolase
VLALQEVPVWALRRLESWSGMRAFWAVAMRPLLGPLARRITELQPRRLRSAVVGQANALLVDRRLVAESRGSFVVNPPDLRRRTARELALPADLTRSWGRDRRVCHEVELERRLLVANVHATSHPDRRLAQAELELVGRRLPEDGQCVVCGDLNLERPVLEGFAGDAPGIDHLLTRGVTVVRAPEPWPPDRRRHAGLLLSDHAPVEAVIAST